MDVKELIKAYLEREGPITLNESELKRSKDKNIGIIEMWNDKGEKTFTIYTHQARSK